LDHSFGYPIYITYEFSVSVDFVGWKFFACLFETEVFSGEFFIGNIGELVFTHFVSFSFLGIVSINFSHVLGINS